MCQLVIARRLLIARRLVVARRLLIAHWLVLGQHIRGRKLVVLCRWDRLRKIEAGLLDSGQPAGIAQERAIGHALAESIAKVVGAGEALVGLLRQALQHHGVRVLVDAGIRRTMAGGTTVPDTWPFRISSMDFPTKGTTPVSIS